MRTGMRDWAIRNMVYRNMKEAAKEMNVVNIGWLLKRHGCSYFSNLIVDGDGVMEIGGRKLLNYAIYRKNIDFVKVLIENGWDINQIDDRFSNALFDAIRCNASQEIKTYIIEKGADVRYRSFGGANALMICARESDFKTGEMLVKLGVPLNERCDYNGDVFDMMKERDSKTWIDIFSKNQTYLDAESLKFLQKKRMEYLFN